MTSSDDRAKGSRRAVVVALVLVIGGALFGMARCSTRDRVPEPVAEREPPKPFDRARERRTPRARDVAPTASSGAAPAVEHPHDEEHEPDPEVPPGTPRDAPPYPPWSQPLTEGVDPETTQHEDDAVDAKSGIHVVFGPRKHLVHPPDPMIIDLKVLDREGRTLPVTDGFARFRTERSTVEKGPWFRADFREDGKGGYSAVYMPSSEEKAAFLAAGTHVFVEVDFQAPNKLGGRRYGTAMMYSREPGGRINGKFTDAVVGGNLEIGVGVDVSTKSKFRLIASLYGPDGETAIAFSSATEPLEPPSGTIPLRVFGKVLHDRGLDGPYQLRYLMLFEQPREGEEYPGPTVDRAHTTKPYKAKDFSPDRYTPPPPDYEIVDQNHPSQKNKPPPLLGSNERITHRQLPASSAGPPKVYTDGK